MALTIRTLSDEAERTLLDIQENNENINTNSKAIEYVLENYLVKCNALKDEEAKTFRLERKLIKAKDKLRAIANGFGIITDMIAKKE